jgi:hypothetical protein
MNLKARTVPAIVQDEEPGGNPGSVRTHGGFLPAQLHFAASLRFFQNAAGVSASGSASGAWSTTSVDLRGPPSLPRAELAIHGLKSWGWEKSRKVRETRSSSSVQGHEASRPLQSPPVF